MDLTPYERQTLATLEQLHWSAKFAAYIPAQQARDYRELSQAAAEFVEGHQCPLAIGWLAADYLHNERNMQ